MYTHFPYCRTDESGYNGLFNGGTFAALQVPIYDSQSILRGTLKHVCYNGKSQGATTQTQVSLQDNSMYVRDGIHASGNSNTGSVLYYLGELE